MGNLEYCPLHVHSDASLDGAGTVSSLVKQAQKLGMSALALTDHGTLANAISFWSACTEVGIKPILGMEAYLSYKGKRHHITLLTLNEEGFNNLITIDSEAHTTGYDAGYPLVTLDSIETHRNGLYALTGCSASPMYRDDDNFALNYYNDLLDVMGGKDNVRIEVMFVGATDTWSRPKKIAARYSDQWVITNDTHYPCQEQFHAHQVVCKARRGFTYNSEHLWLKTGEEIWWEAQKKGLSLHEVELGLQQSFHIADMVLPWNMKVAPSLPHTGVDTERVLSDALKSALKEDVLLKGQQKTRVDRLKYEFHMLKTKGFLDYIYILWDIVKWARGQGIAIGPGRGSGGGSYLLYLLGITEVDPIEFGLIFERFINTERSDYPDVDTDFEAERRGEVLNYARQQWGAIPIATFNCYSHKSAVHDIARELSIPKDLELPAAEGASDSDAFLKFCSENAYAASAYKTMVGQIRHRGKHAAGVIIPNRPVPIERSGDELVAAWAEGMNTKELSKIGIVKYDLLGLTALSQLKLMEELTGVPRTAMVWTYDDPGVYDLFCAGDVAGIFQWTGSDGIRQLTMNVAPRNFYDLITCNALYRPGALDAGTAEHYPEYMKKPRKIEPRVDKILEKTYGVICYQEQVMALVSEVMGGGLAQADLARRLISKADVGNPKWEADLNALQADFIAKGLANGFRRDVLNLLWSEIYTHSGYSYNLSHATTYTMISYWMAWYKVNFREAFTIAVLQYDSANAQTYILDAIAHDLAVYMPHVNRSGKKYTSSLASKGIYVPLSDVSFLGEKAVDYIINERSANGLFTSYEDFAKRIPSRICNNRARQMLERIGAFDGLAGDPSSAIKNYSSLPIRSRYETQLEILKYIVPDKNTYRKMQILAQKPTKKDFTRFAGFISKVTKKKSQHGEYTVYNLSPEGSFWVRGEANPKMTVGRFVSGSKSKFGHSNDVVIYKLTGV